MIGRITAHPIRVNCGLHCYTADKIGRDAGEIVGIGPVGVTATGTVEEIIAAKPADVLTFHGVFPDEDLYAWVLEAGINIVTTADWITGYHRDTNHPHPSGRKVSEAIADARARGGATFYGTGMNPLDSTRSSRSPTPQMSPTSRTSPLPSRSMCPATTRWTRGRPSATDVRSTTTIPDSLYKYTAVFADSVYLMADASTCSSTR